MYCTIEMYDLTFSVKIHVCLMRKETWLMSDFYTNAEFYQQVHAAIPSYTGLARNFKL